jgi:carboxyl-terminal processing protease
MHATRPLAQWAARIPAFALVASATAPAAAQSDCRALVEEAWQVVQDNYLDPEFGRVDWDVVRNRALPRCDEGDDVHAIIRWMMGVLDSGAVRWIDADRVSGLPTEFAEGPGSGIGLIELLSIDIDERTGLLTVVTPPPGSPAAHAGLRPGDVITSIDGVRSDTILLADAVDRIRGEPGTVVTLGIRRGDSVSTIEITRAEIVPEPPVEHHLVEAFSASYGYVRLNRFVPGVGRRTASALDSLERAGARGHILDLRDNPGGLVNELVAVADLFLRRGARIATMAGRPGNPSLLVAQNPPRTVLPLVVLIDRGTASAAEVLAEALQANDRAVVIGNSRTFGKGYIHSIQPLADGSGIMLPVGRLISPSARDILADGVEPAVRIPSSAWPVLDPRIGATSPGDDVFQEALILISGR